MTHAIPVMNLPHNDNIKPTSFYHGGGCGCKVAPGILAKILKNSSGFPIPKELMVGIETADAAAVYKLNDEPSTGRHNRLLHADNG